MLFSCSPEKMHPCWTFVPSCLIKNIVIALYARVRRFLGLWFYLENGPVCTSNPNTLFCQVEYAKYNGQNINPIMTWKNSSGETIATYNSTPSLIKEYNYSGQYRAVSQLSVSDNNVYECQLTFSEELNTNQNSFVARNAPDFTASCNISSK